MNIEVTQEMIVLGRSGPTVGPLAAELSASIWCCESPIELIGDNWA